MPSPPPLVRILDAGPSLSLPSLAPLFEDSNRPVATEAGWLGEAELFQSRIILVERLLKDDATALWEIVEDTFGIRLASRGEDDQHGHWVLLATDDASLPGWLDDLLTHAPAHVSYPVRSSIAAWDAAATRATPTDVMGILNVTPDSFSDGGHHLDPDRAIARGLHMVAEGATILDIGGESTRPGAAPVDEAEELRRVLPVIEGLAAQTSVPLSIDTTKPAVARAAVAAGATIINDISGLTYAPELAALAAETGARLVLMHMRGNPRTMQQDTAYDDVVADTLAWLHHQMHVALEAGVPRESLIVDPGFGFAKTPAQNLEIIRRLREYTVLGAPVLIGPSRKSTIGHVLGGLPVEERLEGTAAAVTASVLNGAAIVRVHDVKEMARVVRFTDALLGRASAE